VDVPEVDVVHAELAQRFVEAAQQRPARGIDDPVLRRADDAGLGRDDKLRARHHIADELSEDAFCLTVSVRERGIDERATGIAKCHQLRCRLVGVGLLAPGHRPEPEMGDLQSTVADIALLHAVTVPARHLRARRGGRYGDAMMLAGQTSRQVCVATIRVRA
jgi:hypothetical protein